MKRLLDVRITAWPIKLVYVLVVLVVGVLMIQLIPVRAVGGSLSTVELIVGIWYGSRVFRGRGEPVAAKRAWWRMTAWRKASGWIGVWAVAGIVLYPLGFLPHLLDPTRYPDLPSVGNIALVMIQNSTVAFLYLNSWAHLRKVPTPPRPAQADPPPTFRSTVKL